MDVQSIYKRVYPYFRGKRLDRFAGLSKSYIAYRGLNARAPRTAVAQEFTTLSPAGAQK